MTHPFRASLALVAGLAAYASVAHAQSGPPATVGRLAFVDGNVSFHDQDDVDWTRAVVNTPLTSGDAIWTEPGARSELSVAGTRVRLDGATQLDMLALDDSQTRLQLGQGRLDVRAFVLDLRMPYRIVTPRGTISLRQQGDYYVEAGSTEDATRLGVRSGSAEMLSLTGKTMIIRAGEVGEIYGDVRAPQLRTLSIASPATPGYWAVRDRQVTYDPPTQYLSAGITGYEDMSAYGSWSKDSQYGDVWTPRSVPADWQPYRTGHWSNVKPWGWTWIDDQPWGYAPYHYGRWANRNNHWVWVPPQRDAPPVYAPALVAFIGGIELAATLGNQNRAPVGWFPLGPQETYVPSYTTDRDYYNRINRSARIQQNSLDDRWQRTQRGQSAAAASGNVLLNQRFATVVPSEVFVRSQPVARAVLKVSPEKIQAAPVALVAAPPAPTASLALSPAPATPSKTPAAGTGRRDHNIPAPEAKARADAKAAQERADAHPSLPVAKTPVAAMPTLDKAAVTDRPVAPGPKITAVTPAVTAAPGIQPPVPALAPRSGAASPTMNDEKAPAPATPGPSKVDAPKPAPPPPHAATPSKPDAKSEAKSGAKSDAKIEAKPASADSPKAAPVPVPPTTALPASPATPGGTPNASQSSVAAPPTAREHSNKDGGARAPVRGEARSEEEACRRQGGRRKEVAFGRRRRAFGGPYFRPPDRVPMPTTVAATLTPRPASSCPRRRRSSSPRCRR
jgi:hypothetical protein